MIEKMTASTMNSRMPTEMKTALACATFTGSRKYIV
jgi:hypothetical protein